MPSTDCGFFDPAGSSGPDNLIRFGPTLTVRIGFDPEFSPGSTPNLPPTELHALVDTGAYASCIDSGVAVSLGLPVVDRQTLVGAHGADEVNVHLAQIIVPALAWTTYGAFAAVNLHAGGQPHSALIGRTFLRAFTMIYNGSTGSVILSRRVALPSRIPNAHSQVSWHPDHSLRTYENYSSNLQRRGVRDEIVPALAYTLVPRTNLSLVRSPMINGGESMKCPPDDSF